MKVSFLLGPTAVGKSAMALDVAKSHGAVILNGDSVQCYHGARIGAAAPTDLELASVPHHLFGFLKPPEELNAARYRQEVLVQLSQLASEGHHRVLIVGGSGFYLDTLLFGLSAAPDVESKLKMEIGESLKDPEQRQKLWVELVAGDPDYAEKIHINDTHRLGRAIEILRTSSSSKPSQLFERNFKPDFPLPFQAIALELDRETLLQRIQLRTDKMLEDGLVEETKSLRTAAGNPQWGPLRAVGYRETGLMLDGQMTRGELSAAISVSTRQLAKRQMTWFRKHDFISWYDAVTNRSQAMDHLVQQW